MALTIRDAAPRKRNIASLVGGIVIAVGCFVLWVLVAVLALLTAVAWVAPLVLICGCQAYAYRAIAAMEAAAPVASAA